MKEIAKVILPFTVTSLLLGQNENSKEQFFFDDSPLYTQNDLFQEYRDTSHSVRESIDDQNMHQKQPIQKTTSWKSIFTDATLLGQLRVGYASYLYDQPSQKDQYATAIGGTLKYKLARYHGFNAAIAVATSQDINFATGDRHTDQQNSELSSSKGKYTLISQAYLDYHHKGFNFRAGRQRIDTPLADSDDIRMNPNTFEAYIATYKHNNFTFMAGNLQRWQGYDAGLDNGFITVGTHGAWLASAAFSNASFDSALWYYNISGVANAVYGDTSWHHSISKELFLHLNGQYLHESELEQSATSANIYGAMGQIVFDGLSFFLAYNHAVIPRHKQSFSGFGGGTLYTNMDTMIIDNIAVDRDASALVSNISYNYKNFTLLYAYGNFFGDKNSVGEKANVVEQDMIATYTITDAMELSLLYSIYDDTTNPNDATAHWDRVQMMLSYNF